MARFFFKRRQRRRFVIAGDLDLTINKMGASFERGREEFGCVRAGRVEAEEVPSAGTSVVALSNQAAISAKQHRREPMSVFDGFTPTLTVSSNSVVNLDGYHSLKIENGAAIILDTTKLAVVSLPQSGMFGYVIANFSNSKCSISLSNHGLVGGSPTFLLSSFGTKGGLKSAAWCARWYFDGTNLNLV
jgi:hypothetical protein